MGIPSQLDPPVRRPSGSLARVRADGKFLSTGGERFLIKGATYGTFAPDASGDQFPPAARVREDFAGMAGLGINTVRVYTPPRPALLDEAARHGLRVIVGLPWSQHVAFLDDRRLTRAIRRDAVARVRELAAHPAAFLFALGNEIPAGVVRWHGHERVERFLESLYEEAKATAPESLFSYVNFPPTEFLDLSCFDVCSFNVYLHSEPELRAYLARLQNVAGQRPLLLAEAGADSIREGRDGQARITAAHVRAAFEEGACGAVAFAWTDEWWRGGDPIVDWDFGLVNRERRPKPAAAAVAAAFADAPFSVAAQATWPRVSVVVCAYNAADTLEDCLSSLDRLRYPDYEVVLVDDGSRDRTGEIARAHPRVRVIETPNQGLSAARNVGLAAATGSIVAYTDADVRVDADWLAFLVQPLLGSEDIVGSGGPNVVPADDPPLAQCVARAPGGPTHVLLDDRVAEHVPGCNMAFRRDALLAIDGFNPVYLRAGDDVDICWRLQARGWKIGFAPSALVWHHHRSSVRAYWRQQVGYGEGETWLMAHHPEQFLDGRALWRGRIYSPLPAVRSLWRARVNSGVWGTAPFPSVYRADGSALAFLPHTMVWQLLAAVLTLAGVVMAVVGEPTWSLALVCAGLGALAVTLAKNLLYALRSDLRSVAGSPLRHRLTIAWLHFLQPLARGWGRVRGMLEPPEVVPAPSAGAAELTPAPALADGWRALRLLSGGALEDRFWSEVWTSAEQVLARLADALKRTPATRTIAVDDGWSDDRDVSVLVGRWLWLDVRALVEEHQAGRCLLRVGTHVRPTALGGTAAAALGLALIAAGSLGVAYRWPLASAGAVLLTPGLALALALRTARTAAVMRTTIERVAASAGMVPLGAGVAVASARPRASARAWAVRSAALVVMGTFVVAGGTLLREAAIAQVTGTSGQAARYGRPMSVWLETPGGIAVSPSGDIYFADPHNAVIQRMDATSLTVTSYAGDHDLGAGFGGDGGAAGRALLDEPNGVAIAPDGDVIIADTQNHRIRRVDKETGTITTIAGSGVASWDGDGRPALETALDQPSAVACAPNGDIYIADTMNNRVRVIEHATGLVRTVAGDGRVAETGPVGDGGPAQDAQLFMPADVAVAANGDVYIADMHHNRVRRVDARTGVITTVAGNGRFGNATDGLQATEGSLAGPAGIALVPGLGPVPRLAIADSYNGVLRMVGADGIMRRVVEGSDVLLGAPSRIAYAPQTGWLYVADSNEGRLVALPVPR
ncbi:MAG: glycosyltransferase [Gemmatimonadetes bacterium]|nr:glycosyltransferase [Gemmatimonadota bacterium]